MVAAMSGERDPVALGVLADVVQPARNYERQELRNYADLTPLNRLADAVPPESETAREFNEVAKRIASAKASEQDWQQAQQWLMLWRDNDAKLQPLLQRSFLTQELAPLSRALAQVADIGLRALHDLRENRLVDSDTRSRNLAFLKSSEKPQAVVLLMVVPSVELLVQATRTE